MTGTIHVSQLKLYGYHGVLPHERETGGWYVYDLDIEYDYSKAAETDDLAFTLNYADAISVVRSINGEPMRLIESVAWRLERELRRCFSGIGKLSIKVTKVNPPIPEADMAGVSVSLITDACDAAIGRGE